MVIGNQGFEIDFQMSKDLDFRGINMSRYTIYKNVSFHSWHASFINKVAIE